MTTPSSFFVALDYAQIELRVVADLSRDERLCTTMCDPNGDAHHDTACVVFKVDKPTPDQRRTSKIVNFGIVYDVAKQGLHAQLETATPGTWTLSQAQAMIDTYNAEHPGIVKYKEERRIEARRNGCVRDMFGARLFTPEVYSNRAYVRGEGERKGINFPVQRGAQGIIRRAMVSVGQYLKGAGLLGVVRPILQIHDELLFSVESEEVYSNELPVIVALMEQSTVLPSGIPIRVSVKRGHSLGEMEEIE